MALTPFHRRRRTEPPRAWRLALAIVAGGTLSARAAQRPPADEAPATAAAVDALGDPLPEAALLRLGSVRFRHPGTVYELALSPND